MNLLKKRLEAEEAGVKHQKAMTADPNVVKNLDTFDPKEMLIDEFLAKFESQIPLLNFQPAQK